MIRVTTTPIAFCADGPLGDAMRYLEVIKQGHQAHTPRYVMHKKSLHLLGFELILQIGQKQSWHEFITEKYQCAE